MLVLLVDIDDVSIGMVTTYRDEIQKRGPTSSPDATCLAQHGYQAQLPVSYSPQYNSCPLLPQLVMGVRVQHIDLYGPEGVLAPRSLSLKM